MICQSPVENNQDTKRRTYGVSGMDVATTTRVRVVTIIIRERERENLILLLLRLLLSDILTPSDPILPFSCQGLLLLLPRIVLSEDVTSPETLHKQVNHAAA